MNYMLCDYHEIHPVSEKAVFLLKQDTEDKQRSIEGLVDLYEHDSPSSIQFNENENYFSIEKNKVRINQFEQTTRSIFSKRQLPRLLPLKQIEWIYNLHLGHLAYIVHSVKADQPPVQSNDFNPNEIDILQFETDKKTLADLIILNIDLTFLDQLSTRASNLAKKCQSQQKASKPIERLIERNKRIEEWLLAYQLGYNPALELEKQPFNHNHNIKIKEKILFNSLLIGTTPAELELFQKKASSAWSQKKFRDSNSHKKIQN
jgi:hypothetical protein